VERPCLEKGHGCKYLFQCFERKFRWTLKKNSLVLKRHEKLKFEAKRLLLALLSLKNSSTQRETLCRNESEEIRLIVTALYASVKD
jgi:hypothetical protein